MGTGRATRRNPVAFAPRVFELAEQHPAIPTVRRAPIGIVSETFRLIEAAERRFQIAPREIRDTAPELEFGFCMTIHRAAERHAAIQCMHEDGIHELMRQARGKIILVRHGETHANRLRCFAESNEIVLTAAGERQAEELAQRLAARFQPDLLFSSAFPRARQTGEIIARTLNIQSEILTGIHERDFGCLKGQPYGRLGELMLSDALCDPAKTWLWTPPGGESLHDVQRRAVAAIEELRDRYPDKEVVVVSHGAVIQAIYAHVTGVWTEASVPPNCGMVVIGYEALMWGQPALPDAWEIL
jgi:broad specificity phosphatase PhoE